MDALPELLEFDCPRCSASVRTRFYGPCPDCRAQLGALGGAPGAEVGTERFEPRMHVVPNHVATKE